MKNNGDACDVMGGGAEGALIAGVVEANIIT